MQLSIPALSSEHHAQARARQASLTKPPGSLGELEELACTLAAAQRCELPQSRPAAAILFAADHPVTRHGIAPYPDTVTAAMVRNFVTGGAAASVLCRKLGLSLSVVDVGVRHPYEAQTVVAGTSHHRPAVADAEEGDLLETDGMSPEVFEQALAAGRDAVAAITDEPRVVILGEMGIGNSTVASAVAAGVLGRSAADLVGPGTGADPSMVEKKARTVAGALERVRAAGKQEPLELLRRLGGRELAALVGAAGAAVERGAIVLVDGFIVTAALTALVHHEPAVRDRLVYAHRSGEPGHRLLLDALEARPLLDLGLRLGEGSGALTALPLLDLACEVHARMATFESAQVPDRDQP